MNNSWYYLAQKEPEVLGFVICIWEVELYFCF